jgi:hypothetical protein
MSKWSKFKATMLAAGMLAALQFGGCINLDRVMQLVAIGSIFD